MQGAATWRIQCHDSRATCHIAGCCHWANLMACHPRATYHIAWCCHLVNSLSRFQSHMPHCRVRSPGEINVMIAPHCRILKIVFRHIFLFLMQFRLRFRFDERRLSYCLRYTCFCSATDVSATVPPIGVKFCTMIHLAPERCFSLFGAVSHPKIQHFGRLKKRTFRKRLVSALHVN